MVIQVEAFLYTQLRISYVVGKACIKVWATKLHSQFQNCLYEVKGIIKQTGRKFEQEYRGEY